MEKDKKVKTTIITLFKIMALGERPDFIYGGIEYKYGRSKLGVNTYEPTPFDGINITAILNDEVEIIKTGNIDKIRRMEEGNHYNDYTDEWDIKTWDELELGYESDYIVDNLCSTMNEIAGFMNLMRSLLINLYDIKPKKITQKGKVK